MGTRNNEPLYNIISAAVDGLSKGDLSGLNSAVEDSVNSVLGSVEGRLHDIGNVETNGQTINLSTYKGAFSSGKATAERQQKIQEEKEKRREELDKINEKKAEQVRLKTMQKKSTALTLPVKFSPVGKVSSVVYMVMGGCGLALTGVNFFKNLILIPFGRADGDALISSFIFAFLFGVMLKAGSVVQKRLNKAIRFAYLAGTRQYIPIDELARNINQSKKKTLGDIKKMLSAGYFPEGHVDEDKTTLMLSDSVYSEYLRSLKEKKDGDSKALDMAAKDMNNAPEENSELEEIISEGKAYIETLHRLNEEIPGEVITLKLTRLENLLKEIFECLKKHPEEMPRMHEVMNYYLPTVVKLVEAYKEYDSLSEAGDEIIDAKHQIEGSIDTINEALKTLLNKLFRNSVWDVTTDASVLNTMLAQKGLITPNAGNK